MAREPLYYIYEYSDVDKAFWAEHLEMWLPRNMMDTHLHFVDPNAQIETVTEEMRRKAWVIETYTAIDAEQTERIAKVIYQSRNISYVCIPFAHLGWDTIANNRYVREEGLKRNWPSLAVTDPRWVAEQVEYELKQPGCIGVKPYFSMIRYSRFLTASFAEADIFDFLPHHHLEVVDAYRAWVTLHVPKADRLGHPSNIRQIREIRRRYPNVKLVIAHLGRCYTEEHAEKALPQLAEDTGIYWDCGAVLNPAVFTIALQCIGPKRIMWGTDNPVGLMRGRQQYREGEYMNRTSHPFFFNTEREPPEIEAKYTLYTYEQLRAIKEVFLELGLTEQHKHTFFYGTAHRLASDVLRWKAATFRLSDSMPAGHDESCDDGEVTFSKEVNV